MKSQMHKELQQRNRLWTASRKITGVGTGGASGGGGQGGFYTRETSRNDLA